MSRSIALIVSVFLAPASASVPDAQFRRPECADPSSDKYFFPAGSVGEKTPQYDQDQMSRQSYSEDLRRASEPSLSCDPAPPRETYRFLRRRAFHTSMFERVEARDDGGVLWAGIMGRGDQKMFSTVQRHLTHAEWMQVTAGIDSFAFWKSPSWVVDYTRDGENWVIEGRKSSQYHVVSRSLKRNGPVREFGLTLLNIAGLDPKTSP